MKRTSQPFILKCLSKAASLLAPVIRAWIIIRMRRGKEDQMRIGERFGAASLTRPDGILVWCHAASVGEMMSALTLLKVLRTQRPDITILLTTGTVSSARLASQRMSEGIFHQFVPVDIPKAVESFLEHWQPQLVLWMESELWPQIISRIGARGIPLILVNGRMSERSLHGWQRYPRLGKALLRCFTQLYSGSPNDATRFTTLGARNVQWVGNIKYDAPALTADTSSLNELSARCARRAIWCAASTHPGEEIMIARAHLRIKNVIPSVLTIIAPRHPYRADTIMQELVKQGMRVARRSTGDVITPDTDIFLVDALGELGTLFRLCDIVFVGGSLVSRGGHNPIEPARLNCAIITGHHIDNFTSIYADFAAGNALVTVTGSESLANAVIALFSDAQLRSERANAAATVVSERSGAARTIVKSILPLLEAYPEVA
jgi:3-deoxy-D-manno-octulosonic-acid transferase